MSVFFIAASKDDQNLANAIARLFPNDYFQISLCQWVVAANTTSQAVGEMLRLNDGEFGRVLIVPLTNYWGWHDKQLWEWIGLKSKT